MNIINNIGLNVIKYKGGKIIGDVLKNNRSLIKLYLFNLNNKNLI
jgi:hypothetical protein